MSFWNRIVGGGGKRTADGQGLPVGGRANREEKQPQQQEIYHNNEEQADHDVQVKVAVLPPPPTSFASTYVHNNGKSSSNQHPAPPTHGKPPSSQPPFMPSSYYSPENQQRRTTNASGAPVIPRHSPLHVPSPSTATPSSPHMVLSTPIGIHIFNPATVVATHDNQSILSENQESPYEGNDNQHFYSASSIPDDDQTQVSAIQADDETDLMPSSEHYQETTAVIDATNNATGQPNQILESPQTPMKSSNSIDGTGTLEYQNFSHQDESSDRFLDQESCQTPAISAATSLVVHETDPSRDLPTSTDLVVLDQLESQMVMYTPKSNSRFVFVSDEKSVPTELKKAGEATMRRRHIFQTRVHELECQLASLTAKLAHESMDRETAFSDILPTHVYQPLEMAAERLLVEQDMARRPQLVTAIQNAEQDMSPTSEATDSSSAKDSNTLPKPTLIELERRLSKLDSQMTKYIHQTIFDAKRENLDALQDKLLHEIVPDLHLEASKADKREGSMNRRWESLAGILARRYLEESSSRKAALAVVEEELRGVIHEKELEDIVVLAKLQELRAKLEEERAERVAEDKRIMDLIAERANALQRVLLEALGDPIN